MDEARIADHRHGPTRQDRWRAIRERGTRGLMAFNRGDVLHLEGDAWAVRSSQGGYYLADLAEETCNCPDFEHFGIANDACCKHLFAVAIAHATRRGQRRPCACIDGWVYIGV